MANLNITNKSGEVLKAVKVPNTVVMPLIGCAIGASIGAVGGVLGGLVVGVWDDVVGLFRKK